MEKPSENYKLKYNERSTGDRQYFNNGFSDTSDEEEEYINTLTRMNKVSQGSPRKERRPNLSTLSNTNVQRKSDRCDIYFSNESNSVINKTNRNLNTFLVTSNSTGIGSIETGTTKGILGGTAAVYNIGTEYADESTDDDLGRHLTQINHFRPTTLYSSLFGNGNSVGLENKRIVPQNTINRTVNSPGSHVSTLSSGSYFDNGFVSDSDEEKITSLTFKNILKAYSASESDEEEPVSLTFQNDLKANLVNGDYDEEKAISVTWEANSFSANVEERNILRSFPNEMKENSANGVYFNNGFDSDDEEENDISLVNRNIDPKTRSHQPLETRNDKYFAKEKISVGEKGYDSLHFQKPENSRAAKEEDDEENTKSQNRSVNQPFLKQLTPSNINKSTPNNYTETFKQTSQLEQTRYVNRTSENEQAPSVKLTSESDKTDMTIRTSTDSVQYNTSSSYAANQGNINYNPENVIPGRDNQQRNIPDIQKLFRNSIGPFQRQSKNLFEMQLQSNNSNTPMECAEDTIQFSGDDCDDLEIDGEKSHSFKENCQENLTSSPNAENQKREQTAANEKKELDELDEKIDGTLPDRHDRDKYKLSVSRQLSVGSYGHTCSGCGRKDCDGNFMKLLRAMIKTGRKKGFEIRNVVPDGNCMFAAVIDQLELVGDFQFSPIALRQACTQFLKANPSAEDGTPYYLFVDGESWEDYLSRMGQEGQWGDHLMLQAVSNVTRRIITIINGDDDSKWTNITPVSKYFTETERLYLGHVGELHYVSMRPVGPHDIKEDESMSLDLFSLMPSLPNLEENEQQQMFKEDYIDPWSDMPAIHLTFLIKQFIPLKATIKIADSMCHQAFAIESSTEEFMKTGDSKAVQFKSIGDVVEGLYVSTLDGNLSTEDQLAGHWTEVGIICSLTTCIAYPQNMANEGTIDQSDLTVDTAHTHSGYARLLARYPDIWGLNRGHEGDKTFYIPNTHHMFGDSDVSKRFKDQYASQNPAIVYLFRKTYSAIYSPFWPEESKAWISRSRDSGWPSPSLIDSIISEGVYYISQPHVRSSNPEIEFQISFGVAERRLVNEGLTKEQKYCFIVFKALVSHALMVDDFINSYHLKNIFFYACEQVPQQYWSSRISGCILYLIDSLIRQLNVENLPNYFISTNNMIDHLSRDEIQGLLDKLSSLRADPISRLYSIAYENMITNADETFQDIRQDIDAFHHHMSVRQSVIGTLVPAKIRQASKYIELNSFDAAIEIIQEAHEDRLLVSTCEDNIPFVAFVTEVTNSFGLTKQWWLCVHADETLGTALAPDLSLQNNPIPLKEIVGNATADRYGELLIPRPLAESFCSFCYDFYIYLTLKHRKRNAVAFLVKAREVFLQLQNFGSLPQDFPCTIDVDDFDLNIYKIYRSFVHSFVMSTSAEPLCSFGLDEISMEVQKICERVSSEESYTVLTLMWKFLGNTERLNQASLQLDYLCASNQSKRQ